MRVVALEDADGDLDRLLQAMGGEAFVLTKAGQPIAEIRPLAAAEATEDPRGKRFGFSTQTIVMPDDFDRFGEKEIEAMFYGSE